MKPNTDVAVMLYDGDCAFCRHWIEKWRVITGGKIRYEPYQKMLAYFPGITELQCKKEVQLIEPSGAISSGAHAVFRALSLSGKNSFFLKLYERIPFFGRVSELVYQAIAHNRSFLSRFIRSPKCGV
ncbi:MAG: DCC1-like thiol-disulfide oxidoreductase family protein [Candidatus Omnitrophica bacterium]|nr:DCC1-like thiol-disulfide oxidoreductase family protein [Candidatus Omnitrophota bacterium]